MPHRVHEIDYISYIKKDKTLLFMHFPKLLSQAKELNFQQAISQNSIFTDVAYRQTLELNEKLTQGCHFFTTSTKLYFVSNVRGIFDICIESENFGGSDTKISPKNVKN